MRQLIIALYLTLFLPNLGMADVLYKSPTGRILKQVDYLGGGAMTDVYRVEDTKTGQAYAMKLVKLERNKYGPEFVEGYRHIAQLSGMAGDEKDFPFVDINEAGEFSSIESKERSFGLLMPIMEYPTLAQATKAFMLVEKTNGDLLPHEKMHRRINRLHALMLQMISVLQFQGRWNTGVNDIKPENMILVTEEAGGRFSADAILNGKATLKILDYDFAGEFGHGVAGGTKFYTAPERFNQKVGQTPRTLESELYSFGGSLYAISFAVNPWGDYISDLTSKGTYIDDVKPDFKALNQFMIERFEHVLNNKVLSDEAKAKLKEIKHFVAGATQPLPADRLKYLSEHLGHQVEIDLTERLIYKYGERRKPELLSGPCPGTFVLQ